MSRSDGNARYDIVITTSEAYEGAGFHGKVLVQLIGEGRVATKLKPLINKDSCCPGLSHRYDFKRGARSEFSLELRDVGVPLFVKLELQGSNKTLWACDDIVVTYKGIDINYPIYDWIIKTVTVAAGKAYTYTQASHELGEHRAREVELSKARFQWTPIPNQGDLGWGMPRFVNAATFRGLPKIFERNEQQEASFKGAKIKGLVGAVKGLIDAAWNVPDNFTISDFTRFYQHVKQTDSNEKVPDPPFLLRWQDDVEFGRQQIMGVTPLLLKRCESLPDTCGVTDEILGNILHGSSLDREMKAGKVFIGDFSTAVEDVVRNNNAKGEQIYCPNAIGLFHVNDDSNLVPIAMQLVPGDSESIFTPNDDSDQWLLAKMYYRVATSNMHEWYCHFLQTHDAMEPFAVALFRYIPRSHPLYKLLRPHLQTVSIINTEARDSLIGPGSQANTTLALLGSDTARTMYKNFKLDDLILPKVLKERGLDDASVLPRNYFRDDALKLWSIIKKFVESILKLYYTCDKDVADDLELQHFAKDVAKEGLGWQDGDTKGMRSEIKDLEYLVELCTIVIYTSSVGHAAVNFPQFQNYQFIPNSPVGMREPPPTKRKPIDSAKILECLPDAGMAIMQVTITYALSEYSTNEIYLGKYPMKLFTDHNALAVIEIFRSDLEECAMEIIERNKVAGDDAYEWLLPGKIPNSIAV